jgi:hypothetical protein
MQLLEESGPRSLILAFGPALRNAQMVVEFDSPVRSATAP